MLEAAITLWMVSILYLAHLALKPDFNIKSWLFIGAGGIGIMITTLLPLAIFASFALTSAVVTLLLSIKPGKQQPEVYRHPWLFD